MTTFLEFPFVSGEFFVLRERLENLYFPEIRTSPIIHQFCITFALNSLGYYSLQPSQEKLKTISHVLNEQGIGLT